MTRHAPTLKVLIYDGWSKLRVPVTQADIDQEREKRARIKKQSIKKVKKGKTNSSEPDDRIDTLEEQLHQPSGSLPSADDEILDWCSYINTFDVCITTYNVLRQELVVARAPPNRPRRQDVVYSNTKQRSPLVMCEWYRVIMDEVQMMGGGKSEYVGY